jgi:hypothetical protein
MRVEMKSMKEASFNWSKYAFLREVLCGSHLTVPEGSEGVEDEWRRCESKERMDRAVRPSRGCTEEAG